MEKQYVTRFNFNIEVIVEIRGVLQLWRYTAGHSCLLMQRNPDTVSSERMELFFWNVDFIAIPSSMHDVVLVEEPNDHVPSEMKRYLEHGNHCYLFRNGGVNCGRIFASGYKVQISQSSHSDPSAFEEHFLV